MHDREVRELPWGYRCKRAHSLSQGCIHTLADAAIAASGAEAEQKVVKPDRDGGSRVRRPCVTALK